MKRILIIDDEQPILLFLRAILEKEGYQVVEATDGEEGMELFKQSYFDLLIVDMVMPVKDGLKMITEVIELAPQQPVIAISGGGRVIPKERYLTVASLLGNVKTISKPFSREIIVETVSDLIGS